jgi:hypothetical protein
MFAAFVPMQQQQAVNRRSDIRYSRLVVSVPFVRPGPLLNQIRLFLLFGLAYL